MEEQGWDLNEKGNVALPPAAEFRVAVFYDSVIGLRLEFFPSSEQERLGVREAVQVSIDPILGRALGEALLERADSIQAVPPGAKPN